MITRYLLNVFIYDHSWAQRLRLTKMIWNYAKDNSVDVGAVISTPRPNKILRLSLTGSGLYLLDIDDLEKKIDGIKFALDVRNNDLAGSIVFLSKNDIFESGRSDIAVRSLRSSVNVMSFLAKDSAEYENEIKECIAIHVRRKICI